MALYPVMRDADELTPVSQCLHHFRASDRVLRTVDGKVGTLTRASIAGIDDTSGGSFFVGYHQPAFEHKPMSIDGVTQACMTLRLGASDRLIFAHDARPGAMGFLVEFVHIAPAANGGLLTITSDAGTGARFIIDWAASGQYRAAFHNGTSDSAATLSGIAPTSGQTVRLWGWVFDNGASMWVQLNQSISSGTPTATATSAPVARAAAWGTGAKLRYAANGPTAGAGAWFRVAKLIPGAPSLAQLARTF